MELGFERSDANYPCAGMPSCEVDITFQASVSGRTMLEDVLSLMEKLSTHRKKLIVVMDEFQQVTSIDKELPAQLRAMMQHHRISAMI